MTLNAGQDQQGRFLPGHQHGVPFAPGHQSEGGRPPGSPNKPFDDRKTLFFEKHIETVIANKFCGLVEGLVGDLGGWDNLGVGQLQLVRRCAMIGTKCEIMEQEAAEGKPFNALIYSMLTNTLTRALKALGLGMKELNAHREQIITVHGLVQDLPVPDTDPASIQSAHPQGPVEGAAQKSPVYSQHSDDGASALIRHRQG
jgi:hypothetical protein